MEDYLYNTYQWWSGLPIKDRLEILVPALLLLLWWVIYKKGMESLNGILPAMKVAAAKAKKAVASMYKNVRIKKPKNNIKFEGGRKSQEAAKRRSQGK